MHYLRENEARIGIVFASCSLEAQHRSVTRGGIQEGRPATHYNDCVVKCIYDSPGLPACANFSLEKIRATFVYDIRILQLSNQLKYPRTGRQTIDIQMKNFNLLRHQNAI